MVSETSADLGIRGDIEGVTLILDEEKVGLEGLEGKYYFMKRPEYTFIVSRIKRGELMNEIKRRQWKGNVIIEPADLPFAYLEESIGQCQH